MSVVKEFILFILSTGLQWSQGVKGRTPFINLSRRTYKSGSPRAYDSVLERRQTGQSTSESSDTPTDLGRSRLYLSPPRPLKSCHLSFPFPSRIRVRGPTESNPGGFR